MSKPVAKFALFAAAIAALPGVAHAGTTAATGAANFAVVSQCSVSGATVNLGSYSVSQTWANVGAVLGSFSGTAYAPGSQGFEYANWGSVTCDSGTPYTLSIRGTGANLSIKFAVNGKTGTFHPYVKKIGTTSAPDNSPYTNAGARADAGYSVAGTGTGAAQTVLGSALLSFPGGTVVSTDTLAAAATYSDALTYTLNF